MSDKIVNHFVLADGSTAKYSAEHLAGDVPEVVGIRTGYDGTEYANAGDAVRGQVENLDYQVSNTENLLRYYKNGGSKFLTTGRYKTVLNNIHLKEGLTYRAVWTLSEALSSTSYCYLHDPDGNNIFTGSTSLIAGTKSFSVDIMPTGDVVATAKIYSDAAPTVNCTFSIETISNVVEDTEKIVSNLASSSFAEMNQLMPWVVGNLDEGVVGRFKKRLATGENLIYDEDIFVVFNAGYRGGYVTFETLEQASSENWSGWADTKLVIPKNTIFKIELARNPDSGDDITNPYDNDIIKNVKVFAKPNTEKYKLDFELKAENGLKVIDVVEHMWEQGACAVGDYVLGFMASPDDHSTNGDAYIAPFSSWVGVSIHHNLGHCASADYSKLANTVLVANGSMDDTLTPTLYLVKDATSIVENHVDILYNGSNVVSIPLTGVNGFGTVACFGECDDFCYIVTSNNPAHPFDGQQTRFIYKALLGKGSNDLASVFSSDNYGTFISGCADNEYNGTLHVLKMWEMDLPIELQGLKYVNGLLVFPADTYTDRELTSYLVFVRLGETAEIEKYYWIPNVNIDGGLIRAECEDVVFHDGKGYVMTTVTDSDSNHHFKTHIFDACF